MEELRNKLKSSVYTIQEQINTLMQHLCLTEEDIKLRKLVCQLLQEVFHEVHSEASVVPFGSTVSGVGWKGSDLDICLLTPSQHDDSTIDYSLVIDVLRSFAPGCVNIIPVLTAKCPLIKFTHQPSGLSCDLSLNNRLGVANSDLLRCYLSLDSRVAQLVFIVRAWAKAKGLTIGNQLSNYALTLMVLYFLQTQIPPVIPSLQQGFDTWVKELSDLHSSNYDHECNNVDLEQLEFNIIDGWNCQFFKDTHKLSTSQNDKSLSQLLEEFFSYFSSEFDFASCVVNIRSGCKTSIAFVQEELKGATYLESGKSTSFILNKGNLDKSEDLKGNDLSIATKENAEHQKTHTSANVRPRCEKPMEFRISAFCVQDPFELTHNLTQNVPASLLKHIVELMKDAHKICSEMKDKNIKKATLLDLLTVCKTSKKRKSINVHSFLVLFQETSVMKLATSRSVFLFIVETLEKEFGLKCERKDLSAKRQRIGEQESETPLSKRQRVDDQGWAMPQDTQVSKEPQDADSVKETSVCVANATTKVEQEHVRKTEHTDDSGEIFSAVCKAFENTWTHCRRERRKYKLMQVAREASKNIEGKEKEITSDRSATLQKLQESSSRTHSPCGHFKSSEKVNSIASPILIFELRVESSSRRGSDVAGCTVAMEHVESQEFQLFGNFFSAYKKHFMGLLQNK